MVLEYVVTRKTGLAISGGVDSMALAAMMKNYTSHNLTGVIVDHDLRPGSRAEAEEVQSVLKQYLGKHQDFVEPFKHQG